MLYCPQSGPQRSYTPFYLSPKFPGRKTETFLLDSIESPPRPKLAARSYPWIGSLLRCSEMIGLDVILIVVMVISIETEGMGTIPEYLGFLKGLTVIFTVLDFSVDLSSLRAKFQPKWLGIFGIDFSLLTLSIEIGLLLL